MEANNTQMNEKHHNCIKKKNLKIYAGMREMLSVALSVFPDKSAIKQTFASQQRLGLNQ